MNRYLRNSDFELFRSIKERYANKYPHHLWHKGDAFLKIASIIYYFETNKITGKTIVDIGSGNSPLDTILALEFGNKIICIDKEFNLNTMQYTHGINFLQGDFFELVPNLLEKIDGWIDVCSIIHFNPHPNKLFANEGVGQIASTISKKLSESDNGSFYISTCDILPFNDWPNTQYRHEFLPIPLLLKDYYWGGLTMGYNYDDSEEDMYLFNPFQDNPSFRLGVANFSYIKELL